MTWAEIFSLRESSLLPDWYRARIDSLVERYRAPSSQTGLSIHARRRGMAQLRRMVESRIRGISTTRNTRLGAGSVLSHPEGRDIGTLRAYGHGAYIQHPGDQGNLSSLFRERERFTNMMNRDLRQSFTIGDDDLQYALGAQTGVSDDFSYLREQEEAQNARRQEEAQNARQARARRIRQGRAYRRAMMDDYDRSIYDTSKVFGGRGRAETVARNKVLKDLPPFMKNMLMNSRISTKTLTKMYENPVIGKFMKHPGLASFGLGMTVLTLLGNILGKSDEANAAIVSYQNAVNLYGKPSQRFTEAAYMAGFKDPAEIAKAWGRLSMIVGDPEHGIKNVGMSLGKADHRQRLAFSQTYNLDPNMMALIDILSGNQRLSISDQRAQNVITNKQKLWQQYGFSTGSSLGDTARAVGTLIPGTMETSAREKPEAIEKAYDRILDEAVNSAVRSAEDEAKRPKTDKQYNLDDKQGNVTINISTGDLSLPGVQDAEGFVSGMATLAMQKGERMSVLTSMDRMVV